MKISIVRPLALVALSASLCSIVMAAPPAAPKPGAPKMGGPGMGGPGGGRMGGRGGGGMRGMMRMMKDLKLTPAQQAKMKTLMDQRRAIRESTTLTEDQKRAKMMAMQPKTMAILTPAQRTKMATMMKDRMKNGGGRMGGPGMGGKMGGKPGA